MAETEGMRTPVPDPTVLTTDAVRQAVQIAKDYCDGKIAVLEQRLADMDRATEVLNETVTRTPTEIEREVGHLRELMEEKFHSIDIQFRERDDRSTREARDNKIAVDAAFAAQKEAAAKQDDANQKAIDKAERTTAETIFALSSKIDDLKERVNTIESVRAGIAETRPAQDQQLSDMQRAIVDLTARVAKIA